MNYEEIKKLIEDMGSSKIEELEIEFPEGMKIKMKKDIAWNHKVNMQKFSKLIEYNEIADMTNTIFEKRIASMEKLLYDVFKS